MVLVLKTYLYACIKPSINLKRGSPERWSTGLHVRGLRRRRFAAKYARRLRSPQSRARDVGIFTTKNPMPFLYNVNYEVTIHIVNMIYGLITCSNHIGTTTRPFNSIKKHTFVNKYIHTHIRRRRPFNKNKTTIWQPSKLFSKSCLNQETNDLYHLIESLKKRSFVFHVVSLKQILEAPKWDIPCVLHKCIYIHKYMCIYIYTYVYTCAIHIYIYIYTYIHILHLVHLPGNCWQLFRTCSTWTWFMILVGIWPVKSGER